MRLIKFRGHNFFTKETVYGQQICETEDGWDFWTGDDWIHCTDCAQLVGIDVDGNEIYEGDKVVSEYGFTVTARLVDNLPPKAKLQEVTA